MINTTTETVNAAKKQSLTINYMRALAIAMVVIHHSISYSAGFVDNSSAYDIIVTTLNCVHVPLFFMISGYLCRAQNVLSYY